MTKENYDELTLKVRQLWDRQRGLVVELRKQPDSEEPVATMTVGKELNTDFAATACRIWRSGTLEYMGDLFSTEARKVLTKLKICHAAFRTANTTLESRGWSDKQLCLGIRETCDKTCPLKESANVESDTVQSVGEAIPEDRDS